MTEHVRDIDRLSPDKLVAGFARSKVALCCLIALGIHVVVLGGTSVTYVRDVWLFPEEAKARKDAELKGKKEKADKAAAAAAAKRPKPTSSPATAQESKPDGDAGKTAHDKLLEKHKNTPVVKAITDTAKPGEIPTTPDDIGITIDETNP